MQTSRTDDWWEEGEGLAKGELPLLPQAWLPHPSRSFHTHGSPAPGCPDTPFRSRTMIQSSRFYRLAALGMLICLCTLSLLYASWSQNILFKSCWRRSWFWSWVSHLLLWLTTLMSLVKGLSCGNAGPFSMLLCCSSGFFIRRGFPLVQSR